MAKNPLAIVTMVYNEARMLPRWLRYYAPQAGGAENLYIIDHGSTDGSCDGLPVTVTRRPREAGGDKPQRWRAACVSDYCNDLLARYDAVLYVDADEFVTADPRRFATLQDYVLSGGACNATFGYDVLHDVAQEAPLDSRPALGQRRALLFVASMCKPTLIRAPVSFGMGFHNATIEPVYGDLYRFHLRYADIAAGLDRLRITRQLDRPEHRNVALDHQKITDDTYQDWVRTWLNYPAAEADLGPDNPDFLAFQRSALAQGKKERLWGFDYSYRGRTIYPVPAWFTGVA
jgi:Glycosyl transferase family 2